MLSPFHQKQVRFEESAARARALLESPDAAPLLAEHSIYIHLPDKVGTAGVCRGRGQASLCAPASSSGSKAAL